MVVASPSRTIDDVIKRGEPSWISLRRALHLRPELGWLEIRTSRQVRDALVASGWQVWPPGAGFEPEAAFGLPEPAEVEAALERTGAMGSWEPGSSAVLADLKTGKPGRNVAFRFDLDALPVAEATSTDHLPAREGFASEVPSTMHACGHDGHVAIGVGLAEVLAEVVRNTGLGGQFRILFQPAEEGARGGLAMARGGAVDGVDVFLGCHLGLLATDLNVVVGGAVDMLASVKLRAKFKGASAHAGLEPEVGRNALLASATAALNLHTLAQSMRPGIRVNVGRLTSGTAANVVPAEAELLVELRALHVSDLDWLERRATGVLEAAAAMHRNELAIDVVGRTTSASSDEGLARQVAETAEQLGLWEHIKERAPFGASEDASWLMRSVQERGGEAAYVLLGAGLVSGHHRGDFDFDESAIARGVRLLASVAVALQEKRS